MQIRFANKAALGLALVGTVALTLAAACDDGGGTTPADGATADTAGGAEDTAAGSEDTASGGVQDSGPAEDAAPEPDLPDEPDEPEPLPYPEGPYGLNLDLLDPAVAPNVRLFDPFTAEWMTLADVHNDPAAKILILSAGAGWCGPCLYELQEFVDLYEDYEPAGVRIVYTMVEDQSGADMHPGAEQGQVNAAHLALMEDWKRIVLDEAGGPVAHPFVTDPNREIQTWAADSGADVDAFPTMWLISTADMKVRAREAGYSWAFVQNKIFLMLDKINGDGFPN